MSRYKYQHADTTTRDSWYIFRVCSNQVQISTFRKVLKCHEVRNPSLRLLLWRICGMINRLWRRFWFRPWAKKWYWLYIILGVICLDSKLNGLKIACKTISMHGPPSARVAKCAIPRKMRGPTQSARAHAKCAGCVMSAGAPSARTLAKCVDRGSIARAALSARAAIAWRGEWAALPTHLPRTWHSMPTQCNRGSTRVGRDEPQSPGTLRVKILRHRLRNVPRLLLNDGRKQTKEGAIIHAIGHKMLLDAWL